MSKNKFLTSTLILLGSGFVTKIIGMVIKVIYTRYLGEAAISLYNLALPTFSLISSIVLFALPLSISKLVSSKKYRSSTIINSAFYISFFLNIVFIIVTIFLSKYISIYLLKEEKVTFILICMIITLPFISLSSIIKGYFFGKQNMFPSAVSNIAEQLLKLLLVLIVLPKIIKVNLYYGILAFILFNILTELFSILIMYFYLPKKIKYNFNYDKGCVSDIKSISLYNVSNRIVGNVSYFFEPIIITFFMSRYGYSSSYITLNYALYNSYAISLLLIPSFFISSISNSLIPEISRFSNNVKMILKRIKESLSLSLILGLFFCGFIYFFRDQFLLFLYNSKNASNYIKVIAIPFVLYYLESPLQSVLIGLDGHKNIFVISLISVVIKNISLIFFLALDYQMYSLVYAEIIDILCLVSLYSFSIYKIIKKKKA